MLILTRRDQEIIMIGDDIKIQMLGTTRAGQHKIGIIAPRNLSVDRYEIYMRKKHQKSQEEKESEL